MQHSHIPHALRSTRLLGALALGLGLLVQPAQAKEGFSDKVTTVKDGLKEMLQKEGAAKLSKVEFTPTDPQKKAIKTCGADASGTYTLYKGLKADGSLVGTVIVVDQAGKEGPLQLLVATKPDGTIYDLAFTVFGEERGKPALSWNYLKQFVGKSASSPITLGKDVDGVSGASYTSHSVAAAVKKAVCVGAEASKTGG
jgi:Na+-translocating ferredoxin:NAD+ oxidoreductase RnfG subunit